MKKYILKPDPGDLPEKNSLQLNPVTLKLLQQRGFFSYEAIKKFLHSSYDDLQVPSMLFNMEKAVESIGEARKNKKNVTIYGDYDADGITSTILLQEALREIGINASTYIPDRNKEGYGLNPAAIDYIKRKYNTDLLITVDCGISNFEEIAYAKKKKIEVIVTDHHAIPKKLPKDCILINPKLPKQNAFRDPAGVGVAFKLAQALWQKYLPKKNDQLKWFLDLVAIGTVADCVPLTDENRIFVKFGLIVLQKTKRIGIQELIKTARILIDEKNPPSANNIAFHIGPRLNAAGRMDHADLTLNLLSENDRAHARILALELESKNSARQKITQEIFQEVQRSLKLDEDYRLIIRSGKNWPLGVLGVVAGKIADRYNCPTFILRQAENSKLLEGSARSIDQFDLMNAVQKIDKHLERYGGHAQAMGIKIQAKKLPDFEKQLLELINLAYNKDTWGKKIHVDAQIEAGSIDWDLVTEVKRLEPFGEGNEEPIFLTKDLAVDSISTVGNGQKHLKMILSSKNQKNKKFEAIYFKGGEKANGFRPGDIIKVIYQLRSNEWNGNHKIELNVIHLEKQE